MEGYNNPEINKTEKERRWEEERKRVEMIEDECDEKVDEGIKETVIALSVMGINVTASCEGHLDRPTGAPRVEIEAESAEELKDKIEKASSEEEAEKITRELEKANLEESEKVMNLLEEFYQNRNVSYYRRIIINPRAMCWTCLESQAAALQEIKTGEIKQQRLREFQEEMKDFTKFLKKKFFSEA